MLEIIESIKKHNVNVYQVTEIKNGVSETVRFKDCELNDACQCVRNIYSSSKAYTMSAIGFLYDEGKIKLNDTIGLFFPVMPEGADEQWKNVSVSDLLQHKTGCAQGNDLDCENLRDYTNGDWTDFIFKKPITEKIGEFRAYSDINFYLLSCIVTVITGRSMQDYLREKLFNPLTYREWAWSADPKGRALGGTALYLATADYVKLMQLWLQDGVWQGQRIISKKWITITEDNEMGLDCRSKEQGIYYKGGMLGQMMMYSRRDNRVVAIESYSRDLGAVIDDIFPL